MDDDIFDSSGGDTDDSSGGNTGDDSDDESGDSSGNNGGTSDDTPYIEEDGKIGCTAGDTRLHKKRKVPFGTIVNIGVCRVW